jgi:thiamine kinase
LQPENALDSWRDWGAGLSSRPEIIGRLGGGRSNHSFLLDTSIGNLVLRLNGAGAFLPGADRGSEAGIWRAASRQGIAPPLVFADAGNRYLVSRYIESNLPADARADKMVRELAFGLLESCHRMEVSAPVIDYAGHIEYYWQLIETSTRPPDPALALQRAPMRAVVASLTASGAATGLCHHDPVIENFVGSRDRLYLIDWEYAAAGLQIMDWAALATEWQIDDQTMLARTGFDPEHLEMAKALYTYTCALWEEATA